VAWSVNGHLLVANIAQNELKDQYPNSLNQANEVLRALYDYNRTLTDHELDHSFVECSTFADDIKYHGGAWQSDFHFFDEPFFDEGTTADDYPGVKSSKHNLTYGIIAIAEWLSHGAHGNDYLDSYMYDYIQNRLYPGRPDLAESYALRLLIHYLGDIH